MAEVTPTAPWAFSTLGVPEDQRVALWESHNADALIELRCRTLTAALLEATEFNVQLGQLHLARVNGTPHVVERDQTLIDSRPTESVALFFTLAGDAFFYDTEGVRAVTPGQLLICDADRPFLRGFAQGLEELVLKLPRGVFCEATGLRHLDRPIVVDFGTGTNSFALALAGQVGAATRSDQARPTDEDALLALIAAASGVEGRSRPSTYRVAAQAYIDRCLADPTLSAPAVAAAVGISGRHLSRVFAEAGTSVPHFVLTRRLEAARTLLTRPAAPVPTIAEVARRCGFASAAHFSRAFRSRYGERPTDVRRGAVVARTLPLGA